MNKQRGLLLLLVAISLASALTLQPSLEALQNSKITLSLSNDKPLRGEVLKVRGRLSTTDGDFPISLVNVKLQYHRVNETDIVREVGVITSNPGGMFEDLVNTTSLLRIGTWVVNASFSSQLGYESSYALKTFTIVVQPALSLYLSTHSVLLGRNFTFNGLLFACIPCIHDNVSVILVRPDNTSISIFAHLNPTGGPYPGGYFQGTFVPNMPGEWSVRAVWYGNDAMLPAYSQVERITVEGPGLVSLESYLAIFLLVGACLIAVLLYRSRSRTK